MVGYQATHTVRELQSQYLRLSQYDSQTGLLGLCSMLSPITHSHPHTWIHIHIYSHTYTHPPTYTQTPSHIHISTHTYTHLHTDTFKHMHARACAPQSLLSPPLYHLHFGKNSLLSQKTMAWQRNICLCESSITLPSYFHLPAEPFLTHTGKPEAGQDAIVQMKTSQGMRPVFWVLFNLHPVEKKII